MHCNCSATSKPIPTGSMPKAAQSTTERHWPLAKLRGMHPLVAHCHLGLGKLYRRVGKPEHARENLGAASDDVPRDGYGFLA